METNILIVEDDKQFLRVLVQMLREKGYSSTEASSAEEARNLLKKQKFDLIVCDIVLPGESGLDFIRFALSAYPYMAAVMMTGQDDPNFSEKAIEIGVYDYITKPFESDRLLLSVANFLSQRKNKDPKLVRQEVMKSEQKYRLLIKHIPGFVYRGYKDWSVDFIDNKVGELTGYDKQEFDARRLKWSDLIIKEDIKTAKKSVAEAIKTGNSYIREYRIKTKTGKILWMQDRGQIITNQTGAIEYFSGVFFEITKQKQAEEKLQQNERYYRSILKHMHENVLVINRDYRITDVNPAFLTTVDCAREAAIGHPCYGVLHGYSEPCDRYGKDCKLSEVFETGKPWQCLQELAAVDGSKVWLDMIISPLKDEQGKTTHVIGAARDVTEQMQIEEERKQIESQLVQSEKLSALGELTAGVSHELNQPLNGIKITSQSLLRDIKKNRLEAEELEEDLTEIVQQVNKMAEIINHMRTYTRNTEGNSSEMIDISTVIEGPFRILDQQLTTHGIEVIKDFAPGLPEVMCDPIRLEQVFMNLITNAKGSVESCGKENKRIEIRAYESDDSQSVEVTVKDNGEGIPEHLRQKIFQPFFTTKEPGKGTGLGLSVSHRIIEEHQGRIELESKVGEGTTFKVILPTGG